MSIDVKILIPMVAIVLVACVVMLFSGCITYPDREDYESFSCYKADVCLYYSAKAKSNLGCSKRDDECSKRDRHFFCKEPKNRESNQSYQQCLDKLD